MYLKEMRTLIKVFFLCLLPFFLNAQSNGFRSIIYNDSTDILLDGQLPILDTMRTFSINSRLFGVSTLFNNNVHNSSLIGLSFEANISKKLMFVALYDYLDGKHNSQVIKYQDSLEIYYPGYGLGNTRFQFNAKYLASKFVTLELGHGRQFIGDGYQSLFLSDIASSYPYLKFTTLFGPVRYYNLFTTFLNPNMLDYGRKKHAAIHYLEFAITKHFHFGVFESVLWQSKSEEANRGYELAYLNPVIFYRPVEFSKQSSAGNALMGINFNAAFGNVLIYGQFMLDDLNISRQKDGDDNYTAGFFQNKYGYQLGLKGEMKAIKYLIEYNQVQPYTYGHRTILQNYTHTNQALAHPLGANFKELINILEFSRGKWSCSIKSVFANVGLDSLDTHYGQNIFMSDLDASTGGQYSYGNFNGQGFNTSIFSFQPELSFRLGKFDIFGSVLYRTKKSNILTEELLFYSVGLRTFLFSTYQDY